MKKAKKKTNKKQVKKKAVTQKAEKPIGVVTHYFTSIKVGIIKFKKSVKVGTMIRIKGATTDFAQKITSMQFDHKSIQTAKPKKQIGIKVSKRVREGDEIYQTPYR